LAQRLDLPIDQLTDLTFDGGGWLRHHTSSSGVIVAGVAAFAHTQSVQMWVVLADPVFPLKATNPGGLMPRKRTRDHNFDEKFQEVMHALRQAKVTETVQGPIMEQLKQCPDAFKVGEILAKAFDSVKYGREEGLADQLLPPAGTIIPPLV
jgi:hypothetical protein